MCNRRFSSLSSRLTRSVVPEGEAAAVEITQKAQTHNNHKDVAPKLGGLQLVPGLLNQPCKTDSSMGSFCDDAAEEDKEEEIWKTREDDERAEGGRAQNVWQNVKLKGGGVIKLEAKCIYGVNYGTVCNGGPGEVCKCVKPAPKPAPLCKFRYPCFKDMHKFDKSRYMGMYGNICALSIVEPDTDSPDGVPPCQREENVSWEVRDYVNSYQAMKRAAACKKELKCPTGCMVTISA